MRVADPKVTIIIPSKNSLHFLPACLESIKRQTYKNIEILIIESGVIEKTKSIAKQYRVKVLYFKPKVAKGIFDAPHKRNFGVKKASGSYVYYVDADMELQPNVIKEAVALCTKGYVAVIVPEDSFGQGMWARAKNLERRCYWGDDTVEAPRFFQKKVWQEVGGLDETIGGGGDDWDLYQKLKDKGLKTGRTKSLVLHNEGNLRLGNLIKKRFMYGRETVKYIAKRPKAGIISYFPIKKSYLKNWKLFLTRPIDTVAFLIMRTGEYCAGFAGIIYSYYKR